MTESIASPALPPGPTAPFTPSRYQQAVADWVRDGAGNAFVQAVAGSGKTTTLVWLAGQLAAPGRFVAFSKAIAEELAARLAGTRMVASTVHSMGFAALRRAAPRTKVDSGKYRKLVKDFVQRAEGGAAFEAPCGGGNVSARIHRLSSGERDLLREEFGTALKVACELADKARLGLQDCELADEAVARAIIDRYGLIPCWDLFHLSHAAACYAISEGMATAPQSIDYTDMIWIPVRRGLAVDQSPWLFVDEAQDLSPAQLELILKAVAPGGRILFVGDGNQSIFGFAGADCHSVETIVARTKATRLPLSICYRCPTEVLKVARLFQPQIEARPDAPRGRVSVVEEDKYQAVLLPGDMVLCRTTAPLVSACYGLVKDGRAAYVKGRSIGEGLVATAKTIEKSNVRCWGCAPTGETLFAEAARQHHAAERRRILSHNEGDEEDPALERLADQIECVTLIQARSQAGSLAAFEQATNALFSDQDGAHAVCFSSAHRCVDPSTLMETDQGLLPIEHVLAEGQTATANGPSPYRGKVLLQRPRLKITTKRGYSLVVTPDHGLYTWSGEDYVRRNAEALHPGNWLRLRLGTVLDVACAPSLPELEQELDVRTKIHRLPTMLTEEAAEFFGMMVADGTLFHRGFRFVKKYRSAVQRFSKLCRHLFGYKPAVGYGRHGRTYHADVCSTQIATWLQQVGGMAPKAKAMPEVVLRAPVDLQGAFLRGLFSDGSVRVRGRVLESVWWSAEGSYPDPERMSEIVQTMLLRFGIITSRFSVSHGVDGQTLTSWRVAAYGQHAARFLTRIGFFAKEQMAKAKGKAVPLDWQTSIPIPRDTIPAKARYGNPRHRGYASRKLAEEYSADMSTPALAQYCQAALAWHHDPIAKIQPLPNGPVMCVEVPAHSRFLQNGFDGANSKGLENPRVFILKPELMPFPRAKSPDAIQQERNLQYVACTRARQELVFVGAAWPEAVAAGLVVAEEVGQAEQAAGAGAGADRVAAPTATVATVPPTAASAMAPTPISLEEARQQVEQAAIATALARAEARYGAGGPAVNVAIAAATPDHLAADQSLTARIWQADDGRIEAAWRNADLPAAVKLALAATSTTDADAAERALADLYGPVHCGFTMVVPASRPPLAVIGGRP